MDNFIGFLGAYYLIPFFVIGMIGFALGWFLKPSTKVAGDLSVEGEGALRAEADSLRARVQDLEARVAGRNDEVSALKTQLAAAPASAEADLTTKTTEADDSYALEWQNRYLAARVKYLDSRLADLGSADDAKPAAKAKPSAKAKVPAAKANATAKKAPVKKPAAKKPAKKPAAKAAAKPKVIYADGPTDGKPDDLKKIKGIGPKFEKDLNDKGVYYYRQIGAWKRKDVEMVEGVIDSFPGRIERDDWIPQAKGLAKGGASLVATAKPKAAAPKKVAPKAVASKKATVKKAPAKSDKDARMDKYFDNVKKFDSEASRTVVENIVKYCGVSLRSRDSSLVACSDETELQTVAKGFVTKKLGLADGQMDLVKSVCEEMKAQRMKSRVTFYYLAAKKVNKLELFK